MLINLKAMKKNNTMLYSCCLAQTRSARKEIHLRQHVIPKSVLFRDLLHVKGEMHTQLCQKRPIVGSIHVNSQLCLK